MARLQFSDGFPQRKKILGPEADLISKAVQCGLPFFDKDNQTLMREPRMPTGFPDLVVAFCRQTHIKNTIQRRELDISKLKLLYHLSSIKNTTVSELITKLAWDEQTLSRCLKQLEESKLIRVQGATVRLKCLRDVFVVSKIIAVEAKITHWRRALEQAVANTWFASHSYVLIPASGIIARVADRAKDLGIGVLVFDGDYTEEVVKPSRNRIPSSYGSWLINEWILNGLLLKRNHARRNRSSVCLSRT